MISFRKHLDEKLKATDKMGTWVKDFQDSDAPQFKGKSKEKRRQMAIAAKLDAEREAGMRKEEVELDESFASNMNKAAKKAHADAAEKIKKMGPVTRDTLADINAKLGNTTKKEEVELDEAAPKMKGDWLKKERERNRAHDAAMGRTPTGRKKPVRQMTSTQKSLAKMRGEEVELDEAEMSLYDKIKAARKNPTPDKPVRGRGSKNRNPKTYDVRNKLDKEDDHYQDLIKKRLKKNEEAELDEVLDTPKAMDSYRNKAKYSKERAANSAAAKMLRNPKGFHSTDTSDELNTMDKRAKGLKMADRAAARKTRAMIMKKEEVELDEQTQFDLVEAYLLENNIDVDALSVEQLDEIIGKVVGGAFKVGAKAAVGAARRMSTAGRADAAEKRAAAAEKRNKDRERIQKARQRLRDAQNAAREARSGATT